MSSCNCELVHTLCPTCGAHEQIQPTESLVGMVGCINGCPDRPANRPVCEEHTIRIIMEVFGRARHGWGQSERLCLIVQKSLFLGLKMIRHARESSQT
jgi:hypothetical protein